MSVISHNRDTGEVTIASTNATVTLSKDEVTTISQLMAMPAPAPKPPIGFYDLTILSKDDIPLPLTADWLTKHRGSVYFFDDTVTHDKKPKYFSTVKSNPFALVQAIYKQISSRSIIRYYDGTS